MSAGAAPAETISPQVWDEICGRRSTIKSLEKKVDKTKEELKAAKDLLDLAYSELGQLIDQQTADPGPLFNGANGANANGKPAQADIEVVATDPAASRKPRAGAKVIDVPQLPFESSASGGGSTQEEAEAAGQDAEAKRAEVGGKDWKRINISILKLPGRTHAALTDHGITTIGKIAKLSMDGGLLTDVKGVGDAAAKVIEEALDRFWAARKEAGFEDE